MGFIYFSVKTDLKTTDWLLPWRAKRNLESLRAEIEAIKDKNEKLHAQSKAALRFLTIRHGLDFLPKLALKEPIER